MTSMSDYNRFVVKTLAITISVAVAVCLLALFVPTSSDSPALAGKILSLSWYKQVLAWPALLLVTVVLGAFGGMIGVAMGSSSMLAEAKAHERLLAEGKTAPAPAEKVNSAAERFTSWYFRIFYLLATLGGAVLVLQPRGYFSMSWFEQVWFGLAGLLVGMGVGGIATMIGGVPLFLMLCFLLEKLGWQDFRN